MSLPPLANVFALKSPDPRLLDQVERSTQAAGRTRVVQRPDPSWLVIVEPVPPAEPLPKGDANTFFTEGSELLDGRQRDALTKAETVELSTLTHLEGDFGFLHLASGGGATFVRSCGGRVPVYLRTGASYIALGTRLSDLVVFTPDDVTLDPLVCATWALGRTFLPYDRTFFRGISAVPRGHLVTITRDDHTRVARYWDPRPYSLPDPTEKSRRDHVERFKTNLFDYLSRELDPEGHNLLTLSGGVDSSSLAALAAGTLGFDVSTLSLIPTEEPHRSHELAYIENLRGNYRFKRTWDFPGDFAGRVDAAGSAPTVAFPVGHPALGLLPRVVQEQPVNVLFGGEFADQVCGSMYTLADWIAHTSLGQLVARRREWPKGLRTGSRWIDHRLHRVARRPYFPIPREFPDYVQPEARAEYRQWSADRRRALARDDRPLRYLALQMEEDGFVSMNWEVASAVRVRRAWPFVNRAMMELAFDCHPRELIGPETKYLLRAALDGHVPPLNLERQDRGVWRPATRGQPPAPQVPELESVFDLERLPQEEAELGLPISWVFRRFLDSLYKLSGPAPSTDRMGR